MCTFTNQPAHSPTLAHSLHWSLHHRTRRNPWCWWWSMHWISQSGSGQQRLMESLLWEFSLTSVHKKYWKLSQQWLHTNKNYPYPPEPRWQNKTFLLDSHPWQRSQKTTKALCLPVMLTVDLLMRGKCFCLSRFFSYSCLPKREYTGRSAENQRVWVLWTGRKGQSST